MAKRYCYWCEKATQHDDEDRCTKCGFLIVGLRSLYFFALTHLTIK